MLVIMFAAPASLGAADGESQYVVVQAGRVITVSGEEYAPGMIVIEDGRISAVGTKLEYPPAARVIDARGETVLPGFIHARTRYGLPQYRRDGVHGDRSVAVEMHDNVFPFEELLAAGFTTVCLVPDGTDITGRAAAYRTGGPKESRLLSDFAYLHAAPDWNGKGKENLRAAFKKAREEIEKVEKARKEWEEKKAKAADVKTGPPAPESHAPKDEKTGSAVSRAAGDRVTAALPEGVLEGEKDGATNDEFVPPKIDPKYQPLVDLIQKKDGIRLLVELERASDLRHLDHVLETLDDANPALFANNASSRYSDLHHVVDALGERKAALILKPLINFMPLTTVRYSLAARLAAAGCSIAFIPLYDSREELENHRQRVAELIRSGLPRNDAIKALTLHPARILGLEKRLGTIEKDRDADMLFFEGDPLDPHVRLRRAMIAGEIVWTAPKGKK